MYLFYVYFQQVGNASISRGKAGNCGDSQKSRLPAVEDRGKVADTIGVETGRCAVSGIRKYGFRLLFLYSYFHCSRCQVFSGQGNLHRTREVAFRHCRSGPVRFRRAGAVFSGLPGDFPGETAYAEPPVRCCGR